MNQKDKSKYSQEYDSVWCETSVRCPQTLTLVKNSSCDIVVIGAGITGLTAAIHLALEGKSVTVLEAHSVGSGGSGRSTGMVNAGIWLDPSKVVATMGEKAGARLNNALAKSNLAVFDTINRFNVSCSAIQKGSAHLAFSEGDIAALKARYESMRALGSEVEYIGPGQVLKRTGASGYFGGLFYKNAGTINPLEYVYELARVASELGVQIFENQFAMPPRRANENWQVPTQSCSVTAPFVLVTTNAYTTKLWPVAEKLINPMPFTHMVTEPLGDAENEVLPRGICAWDTRSTACAFRKGPSGSLIIGTFGSHSKLRAPLFCKWARRQFEKHFPAIAGIGFGRMWQGYIGVTALKTPMFVELAPNVIAPIGYNGRGIGPGTVFGRNIADYILAGHDQDVLDLPLVPPSKIRFRKLKAELFDLGATYMRSLGKG